MSFSAWPAESDVPAARESGVTADIPGSEKARCVCRCRHRRHWAAVKELCRRLPPCPLEQLLDECALGFDVRRPVDCQQGCETVLERGVPRRLIGTCAQKVAQVDVIAVGCTARHDDVQMVIAPVGWRIERIASGDSQITSVPPAGSCQSDRRRSDLAVAWHDDVKRSMPRSAASTRPRSSSNSTGHIGS